MNQDTILILLATYNGEAYIQQQLDSLLSQDHPHLRIVVSDDGSGDKTVSILESYAIEHPDKVLHYRSGQRFGCAQKHFLHLLRQFHDADYLMFCDQDDVWHPDKVRKTLEQMRKTEVDPQIPALVHTDLRVVDSSLNEIAPSFCAHSGLNGSRLALNQLLVQNVVTGCTVMINRALAMLSCREVDTDAMMMHDWWLALLASACGKTAFVNEATMDYRQHSSNSVGAKNVHSPSYLLTRLRSRSMRRSLQKAAAQAAAFLDAYRDILTEEQKTLLHAFIAAQTQHMIKRNLTYIKYGLLKSGALRKASQLLGL